MKRHWNTRGKGYNVSVWVLKVAVQVDYSNSGIFSGAFDDDDVTHVEGDVNPVRDLEIILDELRLKVISNSSTWVF